MSMGLLSANIYHNGMSRPVGVAILTQLFLAFSLLEWARLNIPLINDWTMKFWGPIMRTNEVRHVSGMPWYIGSIAVSVAVFPKSIAIMTMLYLAFGDPLASVFGILYGSLGPKIKSGKSLIGTLAGTLVCFLIALMIFASLPLSSSAYFGLCAISAVSGGCAELLPLDVDDNFSIPLVSGFITWLAFIVLGVVAA